MISNLFRCRTVRTTVQTHTHHTNIISGRTFPRRRSGKTRVCRQQQRVLCGARSPRDVRADVGSSEPSEPSESVQELYTLSAFLQTCLVLWPHRDLLTGFRGVGQDVLYVGKTALQMYLRELSLPSSSRKEKSDNKVGVPPALSAWLVPMPYDCSMTQRYTDALRSTRNVSPSDIKSRLRFPYLVKCLAATRTMKFSDHIAHMKMDNVLSPSVRRVLSTSALYSIRFRACLPNPVNATSVKRSLKYDRKGFTFTVPILNRDDGSGSAYHDVLTHVDELDVQNYADVLGAGGLRAVLLLALVTKTHASGLGFLTDGLQQYAYDDIGACGRLYLNLPSWCRFMADKGFIWCRWQGSRYMSSSVFHYKCLDIMPRNSVRSIRESEMRDPTLMLGDPCLRMASAADGAGRVSWYSVDKSDEYSVRLYK